MTRAVLDTSMLIDPDVEPIPGELAISVASVAELHYGVLVAKTSEIRAIRLSRLVRLQRQFDPLPVDDAVADSYGHLGAALDAIGRRPRSRVMDLLIAATAHAHQAALYTRNAEDLHGLEDLLDIRSVGADEPTG